MQSARDAAETLDLRPNPAILIGAGGALTLISAAFLPWPFAIASTVLGVLMIAGADVDARTFLLPDTVTFGATVAGIVAAPLLDPIDPWLASRARMVERIDQTMTDFRAAQSVDLAMLTVASRQLRALVES